MQFIRQFKAGGLLSFPPDMETFELLDLNVLIGPNGSGKSNLIEMFELLRSTPTDFATAIRDGGGAKEWLWKGGKSNLPTLAELDIETGDVSTGLTTPTSRALRYLLKFTDESHRVEVLDEAIEEVKPIHGHSEPYFYYRLQSGRPVINLSHTTDEDDEPEMRMRRLQRHDLLPDQSVLAQIKDPSRYPEVTWIGRKFDEIQIFREWSFGRYTHLRRPQPADLSEDRLLPDSRNLALVLNQVEHRDPQKLNFYLQRFLPRFERISTRVSGGTVQFYLHESGLSAPIPATRLSDGTIRFIAIIASLLAQEPPALVCIEEPELGMHPDAMALIGDLFLEASSRMQLVVTTHSEALVSALSGRPDSVITCEWRGDGTQLHRLDGDRLKDWLRDYCLGDLWRMGELGANP